jgi:hypothetical protein
VFVLRILGSSMVTSSGGGEGVSELTPFPPNHHHPTSPDLPECSMYVQYLKQGDLIQIFAVFPVTFARVEGSYDTKI